MQLQTLSPQFFKTYLVVDNVTSINAITLIAAAENSCCHVDETGWEDELPAELMESENFLQRFPPYQGSSAEHFVKAQVR